MSENRVPGADKERPKVVYRRSKNRNAGGGHSGGVWKIAYADFVTALMCFFLVMWLISISSSNAKDAIASYFQDPYAKKSSSGAGGAASTSTAALTPFRAVVAARGAQRAAFEEAKRHIEKALSDHPEFAKLKKYVQIQITDEGLVIELLDSEESFFFERGSARLKDPAERLLMLIARELGTLPNPVVLEGHTDAVAYRYEGVYSNWELSSDRANAARRAMEGNGLRGRQVTEVRGYADRKLRDKQHPTHYSNRRVSILARYAQGSNTGDVVDAAIRANEKAAGSLPGSNPAAAAKHPASAPPPGSAEKH